MSTASTNQERALVLPITDQQLRELARVKNGGLGRIALAHILEGPFDADRFRAAVETVVKRHSALRTAVISDEDFDLQLVVPQIELPIFEIEGPPPEESLQSVVSFVEEKIGKDKIQLNHAPMWYICLISLTPQRRIIVGACSRMIMDFQSIAVMFWSILSAYLADKGSSGKSIPQYHDYCMSQLDWRKVQRAAWVETWLKRVDFSRRVSSRGMFPSSTKARGNAMSDMFQIDPASMVAVRGCARLWECDVLTVLIAALALLERSGTKETSEHRFVMADAGRAEDQDQAIGAFQINGLLAFQLAAGDGLAEAVRKAKDAISFFEANKGPGLESLLRELVKQRGGPIPIPYRTSIHTGEPPTPEIVCPGLPFRVTALTNSGDRTAPLDPHSEGSVMFIYGTGVDCAMVSWWDDAGSKEFYATLRSSFNLALARLLEEAARVIPSSAWRPTQRFQVSAI
jgi:hypothetical protein